MACSVITSVLDEIRFRNNSPDFDSAKVSRALSNINSLYHFLRPPRASKIRKVRSLPAPVTDELFNLLAPDSKANPFRTRKLKLRNFISFSLLYQMGLRRGELLNLSSNCMKAQFDPHSERIVYWLNVRSSEELDTRSKKPQLKNAHSARQLPVPKTYHDLISDEGEI